MKGVILLAGRGHRLGPPIPKCLNLIGERTILQRQLSSLKRRGIDDLVCVVGYEAAKVETAARQSWTGALTFVENPRWQNTNTSYSLHLAFDHIDCDFVYLNGDVVFRPDLLDRLWTAEGDAALAVECKACGVEEVKVQVAEGRIVAIGKPLDPDLCLGEFIGIAVFRATMLDRFTEALRHLTQNLGSDNEYFEAALALIVDEVRLSPIDVTDIPCIEIDFPEDLDRARKHASTYDAPAGNDLTSIR